MTEMGNRHAAGVPFLLASRTRRGYSPTIMLIEIYVDLICPWCLIGKRRLDRALAERPRMPVDLRWAAFQLNPDMPKGGMDRARYMAMKFGGADRAAQVYQMIERAARRDGLEVRFDRLRRTPNTADAHRMVRLADGYGLSTAMVDALFQAYFFEELDIGDREVLSALTARLGIDREEAARYLASDKDAVAVRNSDIQARQLGIQAVPYYIFNRRYGVAGAQEVETFLPLLDIAAEVPTVSA